MEGNPSTRDNSPPYKQALKQGQGFKPPAAPLYLNLGQVPTPGLLTNFIVRFCYVSSSVATRFARRNSLLWRTLPFSRTAFVAPKNKQTSTTLQTLTKFKEQKSSFFDRCVG